MSEQPAPTNPRAVLYRKIATVTAAIKRIPKNGKNTFHNYKYATESDLTDGIRELLAENGLAFLPPTVLSHERIPLEGSKGGPLTRVQMQFTLACCDTGEEVSSVLWADGQDSADKGFYKAYTGGVKYFLMKTFLVSTGDDPEQDQRQQPAAASYEAPAPRQVQGAQPRTKVVPVQTAEAPKSGSGNPPKSVGEAERRFFARYGAVVALPGSRKADWTDVQRYLAIDSPRPETFEAWVEIARAVQERQKANEAEMESIPA